MKRLLFASIFIFMAAAAWSMPPMPGTGFTRDGSLDSNVIRNTVYLDDDAASKAPPRKNYDVLLTPAPVSKTILVLLVDFQDYKFNAAAHGCTSANTHDKSYYENILGSSSSSSMRKYYDDMSKGKLLLNFVVLGPYTAIQNYDYYGADDPLGNDINVPGLVYEILSLSTVQSAVAAAGSSIDPCNVILIHAGPGQEEYGNGKTVSEEHRNLIWSCRSSLSRYKKRGYDSITIAGKEYDDYTIQPEYTKGNNCEASIGVFCHEFGHVLGLPDLYDVNYYTAGIGHWDLMSTGSWGAKNKGTDPAPMMNWEKATLGWIPEREIVPSETPQKVCFQNADDATELLRINLSADRNQYLVFDGKKKQDDGTAYYVMEDGLLITQIHEGVYRNKMSANEVNVGNSVVHAVSVVEAKSDYYKINGLGKLWQSYEDMFRLTTAACFRSKTATSVGQMIDGKSVDAGHPLVIVLFKTMLTSAAIVGVISAVCRSRKKFSLALAGAVTMIFFCLACDGGGGDSGSSVYDSGPNTNYYEDASNVHSKTGVSGIRIYDIECNSDGSGSFWVVKED